MRFNTPGDFPGRLTWALHHAGLENWHRPTVTVLGIVALAVSGVAVLAFPAQAAGPTVVSLTFDDGNADQMTAAQIMNTYGLDGTFYITSGSHQQSQTT